MKVLPVCILGLLWSASPAQQPAGAETAQAGAIELVGRVVDWQGTPIAGAAVGLGSADELVTAEVLAEPLTVSDAEGRFALRYPRPGDDSTGRRPSLHIAKAGWCSILQLPRLQKKGDEYADRTDLGDLVLAEGTRLFGRVRDAQGKPVAGARIVATDALSAARGLNGLSGARCAARSGDDGIFSLPCALPVAARVTVEAEGYYSEVASPVSRLTPLEFTLKPSGVLAGRVLDPRGSGVETAVYLQHERRQGYGSTRTETDGSFRMTLKQPGRYRLQAVAPKDSGLKTSWSPILEGPQANLEIVLEAADRASPGTMLAVRCTDKETGQPVTDFKAIAMWEAYANQNPNYREYRLGYLERSAVAAEDGVVRLPGPKENQPEIGCVRVLSPGRAPATLPEVEWKPPDEGEEPGDVEVQVELVPESVVTGIVVDERTGAPIAGAKVWAMPKQDPQLGIYNPGNRIPESAVESGDDGSFRLAQLGEGTWELHVRHPDRPEVPPQEIELEVAQLLAGQTIRLPEGAVVKGKLVGARLAKGCKVYLQGLPSFRGGYYTGSTTYYGPDHVPEDAVDVAADGSFEMRGVQLGSYMLMLIQPSPPRLGSPLRVEIEPFRVRRQGIDRTFDLSEDQPGTLRGKLALSGAEVPFERLLVVARAVIPNRQIFLSPFSIDYRGPRSFVDPSGAFSIQVTPGRYLLDVVDLGTSIRLYSSTEPIEVKTGKIAETNLEVPLVRLSVDLEQEKPDRPVAVDRIEVRVTPAVSKNPNVVVAMGGNDTYDTGAGVDIAAGQTRFEVVLPPGEAVLMARNNAGALQEDGNRNQLPLARIEVTVEAGSDQTVKMKLAAPEPTEGDGEQDVDKGR